MCYKQSKQEIILILKLSKRFILKQVMEVWLRGQAIQDLNPLLQPIADALLQAQEEIETLMEDFPDKLLWQQPAGCASAGFHLLHIAGVLDRLITYAEGKSLTEAQLIYLKNETVTHNLTGKNLVTQLSKQIEISIARLKQFQNDLTEKRTVGRAALPSTIIGLCMHAAEHTMRHTGQLLVTTKVLLYLNSEA